MQKIHFIMAIVAGLFCMAYDVWLISSGLFHPATIVPLVGWMGLVVWCCRRDQTRNASI